jgi:hypothetical protein
LTDACACAAARGRGHGSTAAAILDVLRFRCRVLNIAVAGSKRALSACQFAPKISSVIQARQEVEIEATGRCPPEDVGGPWGYRDLLDAIADPNHPEHVGRLEWVGDNFDPTKTDVEALTQTVYDLARKWNRRSSPRKRA